MSLALSSETTTGEEKGWLARLLAAHEPFALDRLLIVI